MKKTMVSLIALVLTVALVGCGKNKSADDAVGMYLGTGSKMALLKYEYFIVTAEGSVYTLEHVQNPGDDYFNRDYKSELKKMSYSFDGKQFSSGDLQGEKVTEASALPPEIKTLTRVNERAKTLRSYLVANGYELEVRLVQQKLQFTEAQVQHLDILNANKEKLVGHLKARGLKEVWVSDYTNADFYELESRFNIPAGIQRDPSRTLEALQ